MSDENTQAVMRLFQQISLARELAEDCPLDDDDRELLATRTCELQRRIGLFTGDLAELGNPADLQDMLRGYKPVHVPASVPRAVEPEATLLHHPFKCFFAVWGQVSPVPGQPPVDLVYDSSNQHAIRAMEIALAMRGHWHQDGWISIANLLHQAKRQGWACLPADNDFLVNFVCVRCIYPATALPLSMGHTDPPNWPKPWPYRAVLG